MNLHSHCDRTIALLERELAEARKERDYFKGRADRLELMLIPKPIEREKMPRTAPRVIGKPLWEQTLADHNAGLAAEEAAKNERVSKLGNTEDARPDARQARANRPQ